MLLITLVPYRGYSDRDPSPFDPPQLEERYTWDFNQPATLSSENGWPWKTKALIDIGGVRYKFHGGINGDLTNQNSGGNHNSPSLRKEGGGTESLIIEREDGQPFKFYGLWLKNQSIYASRKSETTLNHTKL
ncbi:hypothetical protein KIH41_04015 [Litoribacter ruber]|uniref:hypothetical protein n=1 Tax=Litoribacter ruber TaxID=702568 RepID=UPI001BD9B91C|nr:hypothetical protein [Litoribacter ruber]MBT0810440.1 hypothetical protein [Litoribacter ruber]